MFGPQWVTCNLYYSQACLGDHLFIKASEHINLGLLTHIYIPCIFFFGDHSSVDKLYLGVTVLATYNISIQLHSESNFHSLFRILAAFEAALHLEPTPKSPHNGPLLFLWLKRKHYNVLLNKTKANALCGSFYRTIRRTNGKPEDIENVHRKYKFKNASIWETI